MRIALFPGRFNPFHNGHRYIVDQASRHFEHVIAAVDMKNHAGLLPDDRLNLTKYVLHEVPKVSIKPWRGLLSDMALELGAYTVIESTYLNDRSWWGDMPNTPEYGRLRQAGVKIWTIESPIDVHSTDIRKDCIHLGLIDGLVAPRTKQACEEILAQRFVMGVTGSAATGKSWVVKNLENFCANDGIPVTSCDLDELVLEILCQRQEPFYADVRHELNETFQLFASPFGRLDKYSLGQAIHSDPERFSKFSEILKPALMLRLRQSLPEAKGFVILQSRWLAEANLLSLCNYHVVLVSTSREIQAKNLENRGHTDQQVLRRLGGKRSPTKRELIESQLAKARYGRFEIFDNYWDGKSPPSNPGASGRLDEIFGSFYGCGHVNWPQLKAGIKQ